MKVLINKVKVDEENRLRATKDDDVLDLIGSMKELGQIQPIVVNEYYKLLAGERRLKAAKELEWTHIDAVQLKGLTKLEEFDVELHENWKRKNFTEKELGNALLKRKEIYEIAHPETTPQGKHVRQERTPEGNFAESTVTPKTGATVGVKNSKIEPAESFAESTSKVLGVSMTTIRDKIQVAKAIKAKVVSEEMADDYGKGKIPFTKVLEIVREKGRKAKKKNKTMSEIRAERKKLGLESAIKVMEEEGIEDIVGAINNVREEAEEKPIVLCFGCNKNVPIKCTHCEHVFIMCERDWTEHDIDEEACKNYEL